MTRRFGTCRQGWPDPERKRTAGSRFSRRECFAREQGRGTAPAARIRHHSAHWQSKRRRRRPARRWEAAMQEKDGNTRRFALGRRGLLAGGAAALAARTSRAYAQKV